MDLGRNGFDWSATGMDHRIGSTEYNFVGMALHAGMFSGGRASFFVSDEMVSVSANGIVDAKDSGGGAGTG